MSAELFIETFIEAYAKTAEMNRRRMQRLDVVLCDLEARGVAVLPLKGADLLGRAYGGAFGLRPMADVDLLVHATDLPAIESVLGALRFRRRPDGNPSWVAADFALSLDMVVDIWYLPDSSALWNRSVLRRLAGRRRPALHPTDALIYMLAYYTVHRGSLTQQVATDLAAFIDAEGSSIDWGDCVRLAEEYGLGWAVYHGLRYAQAEADAAIPKEVCEALLPFASPSLVGAVYRRLITGRRIPELGHLALLLSRPGLANKLRSIRETLFPSRAFLVQRYGDPGRSARVWIRLTRPLHLAWRAVILLTRMGIDLILPRIPT